MSMDVDTPEVAGDVLVSREVRITTQGKIRNFVEHALDFFEVGSMFRVEDRSHRTIRSEQKNPDSHLILHTLPHTNPAALPQEDPSTAQDAPEAKTTDRLPPSLTTIPRLISVAEIIKREYLKKLDPANSEQGSLLGLHQYNEIGNIDVPGPSTDDAPSQEEARRNAIVLALQGKNQYVSRLIYMPPPLFICEPIRLRQRRIGYMKITLSRNEIPALSSRGTT